MGKPGWHCTYTPPSRAGTKARWTAKKLRRVVRAVCEYEGADAVREAVREGLEDCDPGRAVLTCGQIDALQVVVDALEYDLNHTWDATTLDVLSMLQDGWEDIRAWLGPMGLVLPEADFRGVIATARSVRSGVLSQELDRLRKAAACFETGGGF